MQSYTTAIERKIGPWPHWSWFTKQADAKADAFNNGRSELEAPD